MIPSLITMIRHRLSHKDFLYEFYFKDKKTLDVGCGDGYFLKNNKDLIEGVDLNERAIKSLVNQGYKASLASVEKLPFEDGVFEGIHCRNVIEHVPVEQALALLKESIRVLKSGGVFVLGTEMVTKKFWNTFGHIKPYPPESIIKLLREKSGESFEKIENVEVVGVLYLGEYYKNKLLYLLSVSIAYFIPLLRREYFIVLKKTS